MAGSRLPKIGDIFTRTTGLLRAGAMKPEDKPLWYDVYEAFPPLQAPTYERAKPSSLNVKQIFYPEDIIRAKFYRKYGSPGTISLDESRRYKRPTICESFVAAYQEIESRQEGLSHDQLMQEAEVELQRQGIYPDRTKRPRPVEALYEPLEEALEEAMETRSVITAAALPDDIMKKINFSELFASSTTSKSSESGEAPEAGIATSATSSVAAPSYGVASNNKTDAATGSCDGSVKELNKDGSSNTSGT